MNTPEDGFGAANGRHITVQRKQAEQLRLANQSCKASKARLQLAMAAGEMGAWERDIRTDTLIWLLGAAAVHGDLPAAEHTAFPAETYTTRMYAEDRDIIAAFMAYASQRGKDRHASAS